MVLNTRVLAPLSEYRPIKERLGFAFLVTCTHRCRLLLFVVCSFIVEYNDRCGGRCELGPDQACASRHVKKCRGVVGNVGVHVGGGFSTLLLFNS